MVPNGCEVRLREGRSGGIHSMQAKAMPKGRIEKYLRPISIPSTILSLTARSTVFAASFAVSVALLRLTNDVEKARGANRDVAAKRLARGVDRARNDILMWFLKRIDY